MRVCSAEDQTREILHGSLVLFSILLSFEFVLALFQIILDSSLLVFTGGVLIFFAIVLAVFFALYYILVRIVGSIPLQSSNA